MLSAALAYASINGTLLETLEPRRLLALLLVTNTDDFGAGSLRNAITTANFTPGADEINFNIPSPDVQTIMPLSPLPVIVDTLKIDGSTQPGGKGEHLIEIHGALAGAANGLVIRASKCQIFNLVINGFDGNGVVITTTPQGERATENIIAGNFIGTDVTGSFPFGNSRSGILLAPGAQRNLIGGFSDKERNVVAGNGENGVMLSGAFATPLPESSQNRIRGNFIGIDASGSVAIANGLAGVFSTNGASGNTVGPANVISGNGMEGIRFGDPLLVGPDLTIIGNRIGTDATGSYAIGNALSGVFAVGGFITIGGAAPEDRNIISGNDGDGVTLGSDSVDVHLNGNYIGTSTNGSAAIPNLGWGVVDASIFPGEISNNVISGNGLGGIRINIDSHLDLFSNTIGLSADSTEPLGNAGDGIVIERSIGISIGAGNLVSANAGSGIRILNSPFTFLGDNLIGTNAAGAHLGNSGHGIVVNVPRDDYETTMQGNIVAFNGGDGVSVIRSQHTEVRSNSIHSNGGLGIDLNDDGATPNDIRDPDTGPNGYQNFPVIDMAQFNQSTFQLHVRGNFNSTPSQRFRLDFYASAAADPSGFGEGQKYVGSTDVTTNITGAAHFDVSFLFAFLPGRWVTATATLAHATSEFSRAISARIVGGPLAVFTPTEPRSTVSGLSVLSDEDEVLG